MSFSRGPKIVTDGLVLCLDAANPKSYPGSGDVWYDLSGNGFDASLINEPVYTPGPQGHFSFNGVNQKATQTGLPAVDLSNDSYTIELWFKVSALPTDTIDSGNGDTGPLYGSRFGSNYQLFVYVNTGGVSNLGACYDDSRNNGNHRTNKSIITNEWVQFLHVGLPSGDGTNRGKFKYYINGRLDKDETLSSDSNGYSFPTSFNIGFDSRFNVYGQLDMALLKRFNRELSESEIFQNYNATKSRFNL